MPNENQRVGEYILEARVGGGAFGQVWRAHHHVWLDQLVAIKIPVNPQYIRSLQQEGSAIHGLVHPNIVRAIGFDPFAATPYLAMEYVPGTSLRPVIQSKSISLTDAVAIMRQILAGLSYAHQHNIIHRDIKPENVLVDQRVAAQGYRAAGLVKVTDFGLGKAAAVTAGSIAYSASLNDDAGREIAGSLDYMAPEQRSGSNVDARADLYACGVILYELLTGEKPAGTDVPSDIKPDVPKKFDDIFRRSYARLEKRFVSAEEFMSALGQPPPLPAGVPNADRAHSPRAGGNFAVGPAPALSVAPPGKAICPRCHEGIDQADQFCIHCGVQLVSEVRRCPKCGGYPDGSDRFCIFCGTGLAGPVGDVASTMSV